MKRPGQTKLRATSMLALLFLFASSSATAQTSKEDEKQLVTNVSADGTLYGFAEACKVSNAHLSRLFQRDLAASAKFAKAKVPHYTPENFKADYQRGAAKADVFAAAVEPGSEDYKRNCEDIHKKVSAILDEK